MPNFSIPSLHITQNNVFIDIFFRSVDFHQCFFSRHLHLSIISGFMDLTLALIRCAPFPHLLDIRNDAAESPLHLAVATGQWQVARWLIIAGASPCPRDANGDSPLHLAAKTNDYNSVKAIAAPVKQQEKADMCLKYQGQVYRPCDFDQWNYIGKL